MPIKVLIVGGGKVGTHLGSLLLSSGHQVTVVEISQQEIPKLKAALSAATILEGSGTDLGILEGAQGRHMDVLAAVTGCDETNLVATSLAKFELGMGRTIARVKDPTNAWLFTSVMGVDVAVNQSDLMAHLIAKEMTLDHMMTLLKFTRGQFSLVEEKVHSLSQANGKTVTQLVLPSECLLTGILRAGEFIVPHGDTVLKADDEVLAVVRSCQLPELTALFRGAKH